MSRIYEDEWDRAEQTRIQRYVDRLNRTLAYQLSLQGHHPDMMDEEELQQIREAIEEAEGYLG